MNGPILKVLPVRELVSMPMPAREFLLSPWLPVRGLAMVHARRGLGKTHFSLGVAHAVATGGAFLGWQAPAPRDVLYVDGEMTLQSLQERVRAIPDIENSTMRLLAADHQDHGIPDLASEAGQGAFINAVGKADLVVLDNLASLCRAGRENEVESWLPMQALLNRLKRSGTSVLIVHHDGKGGQQRGTSAKEDALDAVIHLSPPPDHNPTAGARFNLAFEKLRHHAGAELQDISVELDPATGKWRYGQIQGLKEKISECAAAGMKPDDIAQHLQISRSAYYRNR